MSTKALEHVPVGYFVLDGSGRIEDVNDIGTAIVSRPADGLQGLRFTELVATHDTWRFLKHFHAASRSVERETCRIELRCAGDTGALVHVFTRAERAENGVVLRFHTAVLAVAAELNRAQQEAVQMSRLKTAFVANMSHEIRTPLTGIIGFATVLAKELPEEHREFAELIRGSGRRLLEMLNSVLDLAKLESNEMNLDFVEIGLEEEVRSVVDVLAPIAHEKGLLIHVEAEREANHLLHADRAALNRILYNLIGNAIKFTDEGGVRVHIWSRGNEVGFDVIDTGIGIEPEFIPQLFAEFSQESSGTNRSHSGAGLGLAITKRLVDLMGGRIDVESEKLAGSRFTVSLPMNLGRLHDSSDADAISPPEPATSLTPRSDLLRLLLVEDHFDTQQLLLELLEERYHVSVAGTASEAFLEACRNPFDVILMDIDLGEGPDGVELLQQLRTLPEYANTPIVAVTAHALPGDKERFLDLGFTWYVSKPFDIEELVDLPMQLC